MENEAIIRLSGFIGVLLCMLLCERFWPRRTWRQGRLQRFAINFSLIALSGVLQRLTLGAAAVAMAIYAQAHGWGLLNQIELPFWLMLLVGILLLDLAIYLQHVVFHKVPWLWRLHQVHHADLDLDATTGLRFHPIEILLSLMIKVVVVAALGISPWVVIIFEVLLNASSMFNHSNLRLPEAVDRRLRWLIVTPDMHRIHHSVHQVETDSNYGFFLSIWDRMFNSYTQAPRDGHTTMVLGLDYAQQPEKLKLQHLLIMPFTVKPSSVHQISDKH